MKTMRADAPAAGGKDGWQRVRSQLERARESVCREIRDYPTPIPRCDAQFNFLIEQRDSLVRALQRVEESVRTADRAEAARLIQALIEESSSLGEPLRRELRSIALADGSETVSR